ncbi:uncharacterized protein LACBIDRAFT_325949 [Laccaria bicolor S238N-H82]|uniref:Predicted protein n=1 Tax=Laccaria bicolor (strain S238N-H82 / ATCC MYA-4686) TaxID=486041 RepID=B0D6S7_LACBS|nr:uncharacterized protein LACBIDRAFT_325949 [Laccaria bicolor S238N-H82]EDR09275.1 predicted protein [Laccaria bicolor S238N-H82]|eukprot:XP_001879624.1 predicted protein [Laccaria bicolor S238N-H82]
MFKTWDHISQFINTGLLALIGPSAGTINYGLFVLSGLSVLGTRDAEESTEDHLKRINALIKSAIDMTPKIEGTQSVCMVLNSTMMACMTRLNDKVSQREEDFTTESTSPQIPSAVLFKDSKAQTERIATTSPLEFASSDFAFYGVLIWVEGFTFNQTIGVLAIPLQLPIKQISRVTCVGQSQGYCQRSTTAITG